MKRNQLIFIKELKLDDLPTDSIRIILNGEKMKTQDDFIDEVSIALSFPPSPIRENVNGFLDWIRDLSWEPFQNYKKINLIIANQRHFFEAQLDKRDYFLNLFIEYILPYWEEEVLIDTVAGECKEFNLYLVDEVK